MGSPREATIAATSPHYALEQAQEAAHGGEGWEPPGNDIVIYPTQIPWHVYELLKARGFRFLDVPDAGEARRGMAISMVPLKPGAVVMPGGNSVTRAASETYGVTCLEAEVDELTKGAGSVHCMTGGVDREVA